MPAPNVTGYNGPRQKRTTGRIRAALTNIASKQNPYPQAGAVRPMSAAAPKSPEAQIPTMAPGIAPLSSDPASMLQRLQDRLAQIRQGTIPAPGTAPSSFLALLAGLSVPGGQGPNAQGQQGGSQFSTGNWHQWEAHWKNGSIPLGQMVHVAGGYLAPMVADNFKAMAAAAAKSGVHLSISEGYRTLAEQRQLWARYQNGGTLAARPGTSNHGWGLAFDVVQSPGAVAWLRAHAARYGFHNLPSEPWHWSVNGH